MARTIGRSFQILADAQVRPLMARAAIPGMALAVTAGGHDYLRYYGMASKQDQRPVGSKTLFELGSVTKVFTATLASLAQRQHLLSLNDPVETHLPELRGSPFGKVTLLNLATHTHGGLPLQFPDDIRDRSQLTGYYRRWRPTYRPGTCRSYGNPGVGTFGMIAAKSTGGDFSELLEKRILAALGMTSCFINIPADRQDEYAQGYAEDGAPVRMSSRVLWAETYGIRTTAADMLRFLKANMGMKLADPDLAKAISDTHSGYFKAGSMTQCLIWEQYALPARLSDLLQGNAYEMIMRPNPVVELDPPEPPRPDVWINKTGSTGGFAAYVAFIPRRRAGIVILANRNFPIPDRVTLARELLGRIVRLETEERGARHEPATR